MVEFQAVIFDMDGVIVNSELAYYQQIKDYLAEKGVDFLWKDYVGLIGMNHQQSWTIIRDLAKSDLDVDSFYLNHVAYCERHPVDYRKILNPYFHKTYNAIRQKGLKVALASSSFRPVIDMMIAQNQLEGYFDVIFSGDVVTHSKPHPEIYLKTAQALKVKPEHCLVMEDSVFGVMAAKTAKMTVLGLKNEMYDVDLSLSDDVVDKMSYLIDWIK